MSTTDRPRASADEVLDRLKEAADIGSDAKLARTLGVSKSTITNWRKRDTLRLERLVPVAQEYGIPIEYLTTGTFDLSGHIFARLDEDLLAAIFLLLERHSYVRINLGNDASNRSAAVRLAVEFLTQQTRTAGLLTELLHKGLPYAEAKRIALEQLAPIRTEDETRVPPSSSGHQ